MLLQRHRFIGKIRLTRSEICQLSMNVNASAPYVSVHEPLLYSRKNRLIKRQLVDLRYSLCLRGEWLSLSVSFPLCLPVFSPRSSSPALTRLTCLSPSFPRRLSPSSSYRSVSTSGSPVCTVANFHVS